MDQQQQGRRRGWHKSLVVILNLEVFLWCHYCRHFSLLSFPLSVVGDVVVLEVLLGGQVGEDQGATFPVVLVIENVRGKLKSTSLSVEW